MELGSQPLSKTSEDVDVQLPRPRSGTWGSKSDAKHKDKHKPKDKNKHASKADSKKKKESQTGSRSSSNSRSNSSERRKSDDSSPKKTNFRNRSNSDASKKKGSAFMASMKNAMVHSGLLHVKPKTPRDGSAHPVRDDDSDTRYYHTVTAAASTTRSPMTKVMDIFRKPHIPPPPPLPPEEKPEKKEKKKDKHSASVQPRLKAPRDGSAHPVRDSGSDTQYYHTVTAASSSRSPMTKVMDIFRNRSHASVPPEDRRKV
ncbi:hypothetical protein NQ318_004736, partial [Aromia moschata]